MPKDEFGALRRVGHAVVATAPAGAKAPTGVPLRPGTLLTASSVDHDPTIYVEGTNGELHGFASPHQLLTGGLDPALVVTVAGLGGAPVSAVTAGAANITALSTASDGALAILGAHLVRLCRREGLWHPHPRRAREAPRRRHGEAAGRRGHPGRAVGRAGQRGPLIGAPPGCLRLLPR